MAVKHGAQRADLSSYSLEQVIDEHRILHQVLIEVLNEGDDASAQPLGPDDHEVLAQTMFVAVRDAASAFARLRGAATENELKATGVRFEHMIEAVKDYAIFTLDPSGYISSWNVGCSRMKQYTVEEAIGQHFSMLYPEEGRRRDEPMGHLRTAAIEGRFRGEGVRVRKNGEEFLADVCITPLFDQGTLTGFTKVVQDLTERNTLMQERDLSRADTMQLRADAQYRERFVTALTHDLRSPLATAKAGSDLVALAPEDPEKVKKWAEKISDALDRTNRMIGDLLDASRLNAGQRLVLPFGLCDLRSIAEHLCAELGPRHGNRFRIEAQGSTEGIWNADGLRRVLDNLLSNAVKYGDPIAPITIRIRRVDDRVLLSVHNQGTIIPVEEQQKLFEPFHRTGGAALSGQQGWGIGLALVKGIVEAHKGIVKAESYPIEGTTFTADLPVSSSEPSPARETR